MTPSAPRPRLSKRHRTLAICGLPLLALFAVTALAPLPISVAQPGLTANVLGYNKGKPVVTLSGAKGESGRASGGGNGGKLLMTTIAATQPDATIRLPEVVENWFRTDRAAMPRDAVYPGGGTTKEIEERNEGEMKQSQQAAIKAALRQQHRSPDDVRVTLRLADVGGPSAGLLFSLGIIDKLDGGDGGGLTGGRTIAGTGTIKADGTVGPVGGVPLKTRAAKRDGATVFLVPKAECGDAQAELPKGLRLVPVATLDGALKSLKALKDGGRVPRC
ncbi:MAG: S16 family serine protease [Streptomyces sp.]|uniref:S16 family serine protease n=1 Tax=Streptomyces sp. TaxID=1931 RepID=UPI003D6AD8B1